MRKLRFLRSRIRKLFASRIGIYISILNVLLVLYWIMSYGRFLSWMLTTPTSWLISFMQFVFGSLTKWYDSFSPNIGFISDVIALQGAVIAIALPLSFELVSRTSERYQSGIITKEFNKDWVIRSLRPLVVVDIFLGVSIKFFFSGNSATGGWKFLAWLTFLLFVITLICLLLFFKKLQDYTTNVDFLSKKLLSNLSSTLDSVISARKINPKLLKLKQAKLIESLQGFGDILIFEAKNKKNDEYIAQRLRELEEQIRRLLNIRRSNPHLFDRIILSQEFFKLHEKDENSAEFSRAVFPEYYVVSFSTAINQIAAIRNAALEVNNVEVARSATYHIINTLAAVCEVGENNELAALILQELAGFRKSIVNDIGLSYTNSITWYTRVVFNDSFDVSYLSLFNGYFTSFVHDIIASNQAKIFQLLISTLIDSGELKQFHGLAVQGFESLLMRLDIQTYLALRREHGFANKLKKLSSPVRDNKQLEEALLTVRELEHITVSRFQQEEESVKKEIKRLEKLARFSLKFNSLIYLIFDAGAYCIFRERLDYLQLMWNYKQPPDADALWLGHDIIPEGVSGVINFYFKSSFFQGNLMARWDDHHGSEIYYKQYFLLLLARELCKFAPDTTIRLSDDFDHRRLSSIAYSVDELLPLANQIKSFHSFFEMKLENFSDIIDYRLIPCLRDLRAKAEAQIIQLVISKEVSPQKIEAFKSGLYRGYDELVIVRGVLDYYNLYGKKLTEVAPHSPFSISRRMVINKTSFLDDWYENDSELGTNYGRRIARDEDTLILEKVVESAVKIEIGATDLEAIFDALGQNTESFVILCLNSYAEILSLSSRFTHTWNEKNTEVKPRGYIGSYRIREISVPVFEVFLEAEVINLNLLDESFLFLNTSKLCQLIQFSPNRVVNPNSQEEIYISIQDISRNQALLETLLQESPDWLREIGSIEEQIRHLKTQVLLEFNKTLMVELHEEFQGYFISVSSSNSRISDFVA